MNDTFKKIVLSVSLTTFIFSSMAVFAVLAVAPKKAYAGSESCMAVIAGALASIVTSSVVGTVLGVPTAPSDSIGNGMTTGYTGGTFVKECIIKPLLDALIRTLIKEFTVSIIDWINGGFNGSPRFISDFGGFMADVGDQVAGQMIYDFGAIGKVLCSPFDLDLRIALAAHYSFGNNFRYQVTCRLSDVTANIKGFTSGNFSDGGWQSWVDVTTVPENNIYGSYTKSIAAMDARITGAKNIKLAQADWGRGFLSLEKCNFSEEGSMAQLYTTQQQTGEDAYLAQLEAKQYRAKECQTVTPGSTIQDSLSHTLGSDLRRYEVAESIDAILGALMNQLVGRVFSSTGLFSARTSTSQYQSYLDELAKSNFDPQIQPPASFQNTSCSDFYALYILEVASDGTSVVKKKNTTSNTYEATNPVISEADYRNMKSYCETSGYQNKVNSEIDKFTELTTDKQNDLLLQILSAQNTSDGIAQATSIETFNTVTYGAYSIDESTQGGEPSKAIDYSDITHHRNNNNGPLWWGISFNTSEYISKVIITSSVQGAPLETVRLHFFGTDPDFNNLKVQPTYSGAYSFPESSTATLPNIQSKYDVKLSRPIKSKALVLTTNNDEIFLSDMKFYRYVQPVIKVDPLGLTLPLTATRDEFDAKTKEGVYATDVNPSTPVKSTNFADQVTLGGEKIVIIRTIKDPSGNTVTLSSLPSPLKAGNYKISYIAKDETVDDPATTQVIETIDSATVTRTITIK